MRYVFLVLAIVVCTRFLGSMLKILRVFLGIQISLHYILSFAHEGYGRATSLDSIKNQFGVGKGGEPPYRTPVSEDYYVHNNVTSPQGRKANAAIVMLGAYLPLLFAWY